MTKRVGKMTTKQIKQASNIPPDPEEMNDLRAHWAGSALRDFRENTGTDLEDAVSDLLTDLMHWCDRHGQDFEHELRRACLHYEAETEA
jgi:hypothetical protein